MTNFQKFSPYVENFLKNYDQTNMVVSNFRDIAQPGIYEIFNIPITRHQLVVLIEVIFRSSNLSV